MKKSKAKCQRQKCTTKKHVEALDLLKEAAMLSFHNRDTTFTIHPQHRRSWWW